MISLENKKKAVDFWKSGKTKRLSLTTVSNRYRFVTSLPQLYNFEKQLEKSGTRHDVLREVWTYTYQFTPEFLRLTPSMRSYLSTE